ncbi:hypothetical protein GGR53DRAFT_466292 [Hypoxylon sp. FL1150]|nr:hypothetical protein GGR53DRAFT_466292 [Hypoxylon sp. FL1150]
MPGGPSGSGAAAGGGSGSGSGGPSGTGDGSGSGSGGPSGTGGGTNKFAMANPFFDLVNNDFLARRRERKEKDGLLGGHGIEDTVEAEVEATIAELEAKYGQALPQAERERLTNSIHRIRGGGWLEAAKVDLVGKSQVPIALFNRLVAQYEGTIGFMSRRMKYYDSLADKAETNVENLRRELDASKAANAAGPGANPNLKEFWNTVDQTRHRMTAIEQAVRRLYATIGFPDEQLSVEQIVERITTSMRDQPNGEVELRISNTMLAMDKVSLKLEVDAEKEQNRLLQDRLDRARPQAEMEHEMRIEYGLFNEEEVARRADATTQVYRIQRRELMDNLIAARAICVDVSRRCAAPDQAQLRRAADEYLNLLTLPPPRPQNPRQPRVPGTRPGGHRPNLGGGGAGGTNPAPGGAGLVPPPPPGVGVTPTTPGGNTGGPSGTGGQSGTGGLSGKGDLSGTGKSPFSPDSPESLTGSRSGSSNSSHNGGDTF